MLLGHVEEREIRISSLKCVQLYANLAMRRLKEIPGEKRIGILNFEIREQSRRNLKVDVK